MTTQKDFDSIVHLDSTLVRDFLLLDLDSCLAGFLKEGNLLLETDQSLPGADLLYMFRVVSSRRLSSARCRLISHR